MLLDHIVILVDDLDLASRDYTTLGFSVVVGGKHADGLTQNSLVAFEDGSYLELLNFLSPPPDEHLFARGAQSAEGIIAYALLPEDIEADIARSRRHGLHIRGPIRGGRLRPDGLEIAWQTGRIDHPALPFLCADLTPRDLRVPHGPAMRHANGVSGIAEVEVLVDDLDEAARLYSALLGDSAEMAREYGQHAPDVVRFKLARSTLSLHPARDAAEQRRLKSHGPGAHALTLLSTYPGAEYLDPERTHGLEINVAGGK
ncbi:MAG TPA: VOC family protein [Chloroflexia bacterium]|jgi:catechol 2,3-dioxygenase-like lactoylglutathione lyase family enzyme